MNGQEALALLVQRCGVVIAQRHSHNTGPEVQCLLCEDKARLSEGAGRVFCGTACQRLLQGLTQLGVKRGLLVDVQEGEAFVEVDGVPDDVLVLLFEVAFRRRLMSVRQYRELAALRQVSVQYRQVIDLVTVPRVQFLCGAVLALMPDEELAQYTGLLQFYTLPRFRYNAVPFLFTFTHLRRLYLSEVTLPREEAAFDALSRLEHLTVHGTAMGDGHLRRLQRLTELELTTCFGVTNAGVASLPLLRRLVLTRTHVTDLNACTQLQELSVSRFDALNDAGLAALVNLQVLELPAGGLYGSDPRSVTNACLSNMPRLRALHLRNNAALKTLVVAATGQRVPLPQLETLQASGRLCGFDLDEVRHLPTLTALDVANHPYAQLQNDWGAWLADPRITPRLIIVNTAGWSQWQWPLFGDAQRRIISLAASEPLRVDHDLWHDMRQLERLHLDKYAAFTDDDLLALRDQLRVLTVVGPTGITDVALAQMSHLRELSLTKTTAAEITYVGVSALPQLRYLYAKETRLSRAELESLKAQGVTVFDDLSVTDYDARPPHMISFTS